jgi:diaminopimelate epimerase
MWFIFVDSLAAVDVAKLAPAIQNDPLFPEGVNVGVDPGTIRLAVWERPDILTGACGTGGLRRGLRSPAACPKATGSSSTCRPGR